MSLHRLIGGILTHTRGRQVNKLRMQRKGAHGIVRIRVLPAARHRGVVDGQQLDHVLAGLHGPVHQFFKVVELSYAETVLGAEGEHGDGHAGTSPGLGGETGLDIGQHYLRILRGHLGEEMIRAVLPVADLLGLCIYDYEFILYGLCDFHSGKPPGGDMV